MWRQMFREFTIVVVPAAVRATSALILPLLIAWPAAAQETSPPSIVTSGDAVVRRTPDEAFITAAVEAHARSPRDAGRQAAETMTAVRQRVTVLGISADGVRTAGYGIEQEADFVDGRRVPRGYVARNVIEIRVDAIDRAGEVLDALVSAGATSVSGVRFDLKDRAGAEREAVRLAVADARARADAAAAGVGRTVDRVLRIEEARETPAGPRPVLMTARAADVQPITPIDAGMIEVRAHVTLMVSFK
jgi:uncharacterized protein YggE